VLWLARPKPLVPRERGMQMSDRWRIEHLYELGKR
jgi:hypothetical protein